MQVDVSDNGVGIDPRDHESIFEKFRQVGDTFGGERWVDSVPGAGATFSFTLPLTGAAGGQ